MQNFIKIVRTVLESFEIFIKRSGEKIKKNDTTAQVVEKFFRLLNILEPKSKDDSLTFMRWRSVGLNAPVLESVSFIAALFIRLSAFPIRLLHSPLIRWRLICIVLESIMLELICLLRSIKFNMSVYLKIEKNEIERKISIKIFLN